MKPETAITTRTSARLMTATVLALTAMHAALRVASLDHLVGAAEQGNREGDAQRLGGFQIEN